MPDETYGNSDYPIEVIDAREDFPTLTGSSLGATFHNRRLDQVTGIAIHHDAIVYRSTGTNAEITRLRAIYNWHTRFYYTGYEGRTPGPSGWNWPSFGYHLAVFPSGNIYRLGAPDTIRAHVAGRNTELYGIVAIGDFSHDPPSQRQIVGIAQAAVVAIEDIGGTGRTIQLKGHREWATTAWATSCPGGTYRAWMPKVGEQVELIAGELGNPPSKEGDDDMAYLAWDIERQRVYYIGGWGAAWITNGDDVEELKLRGAIPGDLVALHSTTIDAINAAAN